MSKQSPFKIAFGAIFFMSICFFLYNFESIGTSLKISRPKHVENSNFTSTTIQTLAPTTVKSIKSTPTTVKKPAPKSTKKPAAVPTDRIDPKKLDVEQIEADFPMGYKNPRSWFLPLPGPNEKELLQILTAEQRELLPSFGAQAQLSQKQLDKINSFYGINREGGWQDHIESLDDDGLAPLTKWAQSYIYNHQHPASCKGKKFYILEEKAPWYGLGAAVRVIFRELELAISVGRILVLDPKNPPGGHLMSNDCGAYRGRNASLECVLEDITSCTSYATPENSVREIDIGSVPGGNKYVPPLPAVALTTYMKQTGLPTSGAFLRYWWHAQMYAYIFRPNQPTLARMVEMRTNKTLHTAVDTNVKMKDGKAKLHTVPFPLPPSTISMHIRHGDKAIEGRLISTRDYIVAAERFVLRNPILYRKRAFVTTEDPGAIAEIKRTTGINPVSTTFANLQWYWFYSNIPRFDGSPFQNLRLSENRTDAMITHIMQLWMAIECDTFVGNRNSNWNKLIDSIRCTLMDKCRAPYLDAGYSADWLHFP
ncbi:mitochondrial inner membrane protein required for protein import [Arthrobotrys megalospora]